MRAIARGSISSIDVHCFITVTPDPGVTYIDGAELTTVYNDFEKLLEAHENRVYRMLRRQATAIAELTTIVKEFRDEAVGSRDSEPEENEPTGETSDSGETAEITSDADEDQDQDMDASAEGSGLASNIALDSTHLCSLSPGPGPVNHFDDFSPSTSPPCVLPALPRDDFVDSVFVPTAEQEIYRALGMTFNRDHVVYESGVIFGQTMESLASEDDVEW